MKVLSDTALNLLFKDLRLEEIDETNEYVNHLFDSNLESIPKRQLGIDKPMRIGFNTDITN